MALGRVRARSAIRSACPAAGRRGLVAAVENGIGAAPRPVISRAAWVVSSVWPWPGAPACDLFRLLASRLVQATGLFTAPRAPVGGAAAAFSLAAGRRPSSPTWWPWLSLICLKWSTSIRNSTWRVPSGPRWTAIASSLRAARGGCPAPSHVHFAEPAQLPRRLRARRGGCRRRADQHGDHRRRHSCAFSFSSAWMRLSLRIRSSSRWFDALAVRRILPTRWSAARCLAASCLGELAFAFRAWRCRWGGVRVWPPRQRGRQRRGCEDAHGVGIVR